LPLLFNLPFENTIRKVRELGEIGVNLGDKCNKEEHINPI